MNPIKYRILENDTFTVGEDDFSQLEIASKPSTASSGFHYFYHRGERRLITSFILQDLQRVYYACQVTLIKKGDNFTPRLALTIRNKGTKNIEEATILDTPTTRSVKASINLNDCHDSFWQLINFIQTFRNIELPQGERFSLVSGGEREIVAAIRGRDTASIINIIKQLSATEGISLSLEDINELQKRKEKLAAFKQALTTHANNESWWQDFFEEHKWIFGYGLNYQILRQEQAQPNYGGAHVDGRGGQRGDYLASTMGDINFTVLVEIKTPATPLLQGANEIRNGAWSLSKELTDAISQVQANASQWGRDGANQPDNRDRLEGNDVFTVEPKGIVVIGALSEVGESRSKRETFQRFRKSLHGIDVITFDELYQRARFIVRHKTAE